jgi:hypothetical protein
MMDQQDEGTWIEWSRYVITELRRLGDEAKAARDHHEKTNVLLQEYNTQLKLHIAGVQILDKKTDLLKQEIEGVKGRLEVAELPISWAQTTGKVFVWVGGFAGLVGAIYAAVVFLKK